MSISADSYPNRGSGQADSGNDVGRFMRDNVRPPSSGFSDTPSDDTPERPTVQPEDLHHDPAAPRSGVNAETLGAMHAPQTTIKHGNPTQPGFPAGWTAAKNPNQAAE
jgi:hypothetical protein